MITYADIYEAARRERYSERLQPLPKNFLREVAEYLKEKKQLALKKDDSFADVVLKTKKQIENAMTSLKEIIRRRRKKILNLILVAAETGISRQDFENMLDFEKELFENLMKEVELSDKKIELELRGEKPLEDSANQLVVFKEDVDSFLDPEGNEVGPFSKGDVANIPKQIAKILLEAGKVEVLEE